MKRSWNWPLWIGALVTFLGVASYPAYFVRFPALRDFPWANLPIIGIGLALLGVGLKRAFQHPELHRGKIFGSLVAALSLAISALFLYGVFIGGRHVLPASPGAPQVGQTAPDFTLPDSRNNPVSLQGVLNSPFAAAGRSSGGMGADKTAGVVLIFYRGYW